MRDRESGFTLVELMVTLAVVSILAVIALPSFLRESRKTRASSEVQPMFNDLRVKLEQYLQENGKYPDTIGEGSMHPAGDPVSTARPLYPLPKAWDDVRVRISGNDTVYCSYTWATGLADRSDNIGKIAGDDPPAGFGFRAPAINWYYLLARCDMNGDGAFSYYFTSSTNPTIQAKDPGD
ncbi:MAG TPA: type II secretion system protein [Kofleriaceae bacterium]|nr:type II secretion system protein [Kofleriaceae bacterium]